MMRVVPPGMMAGVMRMRWPPCAMVGSCRCGGGWNGECRRTQRQCEKRPAERRWLKHTQFIISSLTPPIPTGPWRPASGARMKIAVWRQQGSTRRWAHSCKVIPW